jgi:hypothetical protein
VIGSAHHKTKDESERCEDQRLARAHDFPKLMTGGWRETDHDRRNVGAGCGRLAEFAQDGAVRQDQPGNASWNREGAMDVLLGIVAFIGHAIEAVLIYIESHHWIFGLLALGYIFYLHDRALHARFDALEKRLDEIRKRLAVEY